MTDCCVDTTHHIKDSKIEDSPSRVLPTRSLSKSPSPHTIILFICCRVPAPVPPSHTRPSASNLLWLELHPSRKASPSPPALMTNAPSVTAVVLVLLCPRLVQLVAGAAPLSLITPPSLFVGQLQAITRSSRSSSTSALTAMTTYEDFEAYDGGDYKIFVGRVSVLSGYRRRRRVAEAFVYPRRRCCCCC